MNCDGKIRECTVYNRHIYHRTTHWIAESAEAVKAKVKSKPKGDFTSDKPVDSEVDNSKCECPKGCKRILEEAEFGITRENLATWWEDRSSATVPEIIYHRRRTTVQEINSKIRCVKPKKEKKMVIAEGQSIPDQWADLGPEQYASTSMGAVFSKDRHYRYSIWRKWANKSRFVLFICLNPSIADESTDDPTLMKCLKYAKTWGYDGVRIANLFAYVASEPSEMKKAENPIGPDNDAWLVKLSKEASLVIAAWGNDGSFQGRSQQVIKLIPGMHCLKVNKTGEPAHPLYLTDNLKPKIIK